MAPSATFRPGRCFPCVKAGGSFWVDGSWPHLLCVLRAPSGFSESPEVSGWWPPTLLFWNSLCGLGRGGWEDGEGRRAPDLQHMKLLETHWVPSVHRAVALLGAAAVGKGSSGAVARRGQENQER